MATSIYNTSSIHFRVFSAIYKYSIEKKGNYPQVCLLNDENGSCFLTSSSSSELLLEAPWSLTFAQPADATAAARLSPSSFTHPKLRPLAPAWNSSLKMTYTRRN